MLAIVRVNEQFIRLSEFSKSPTCDKRKVVIIITTAPIALKSIYLFHNYMNATFQNSSYFQLVKNHRTLSVTIFHLIIEAGVGTIYLSFYRL